MKTRRSVGAWPALLAVLLSFMASVEIGAQVVEDDFRTCLPSSISGRADRDASSGKVALLCVGKVGQPITYVECSYFDDVFDDDPQALGRCRGMDRGWFSRRVAQEADRDVPPLLRSDGFVRTWFVPGGSPPPR